jgi:hypothetical protein
MMTPRQLFYAWGEAMPIYLRDDDFARKLDALPGKEIIASELWDKEGAISGSGAGGGCGANAERKLDIRRVHRE